MPCEKSKHPGLVAGRQPPEGALAPFAANIADPGTSGSAECFYLTGGYIASPSHDYLLPETKVENVFALYETVREFGNY